MFFRFLLCVCLTSFFTVRVSFAQKDSLYKHEMEMHGDAYINSDAITNEFFFTLLKGRHIDTEIKENVLNRVRYISRWGTDLNYGITWSYSPDSLFGKKGLSTRVEINDRMHANGIFSKDFFEVAMYGNLPFAGKSADLGNFRFNFLRYQQVLFGLEWEADSGRNARGIAISLLKGEQHFQADVRRADLFTAEDGSYIDLDTKLQTFQSDTSKKGPGAFNGIGVSTDMYYEIPYLTWYNEGVMTLNLYDLGFISWNKRSMHHQLDTFFHFEGLEVNDIFDLQENTFPQSDPDSLLNNNLHYSTGSYVTLLPAIFSITATTYYGKKYIVEKGINYRFGANARPYYYGSFVWNIRPKFLLAWNLSYGGYGKFNAGMETVLKVGKRFKFKVNSFYLAGLALASKMGGAGGSVSISGKF